jgi:hypothetical protein
VYVDYFRTEFKIKSSGDLTYIAVRGRGIAHGPQLFTSKQRHSQKLRGFTLDVTLHYFRTLNYVQLNILRFILRVFIINFWKTMK